MRRTSVKSWLNDEVLEWKGLVSIQEVYEYMPVVIGAVYVGSPCSVDGYSVYIGDVGGVFSSLFLIQHLVMNVEVTVVLFVSEATIN